MKTAEEMLLYYSHKNVVEAMKAYAAQAIDEAAKRAKIQKIIDVSVEPLVQIGYHVDVQSILSVKDELK